MNYYRGHRAGTRGRPAAPVATARNSFAIGVGTLRAGRGGGWPAGFDGLVCLADRRSQSDARACGRGRVGQVERGPRNGAEAVLDKAAADDTKSQESAKVVRNGQRRRCRRETRAKKDAETEPPAAAGGATQERGRSTPGAVGVSGQIDGVALRDVSDNSGKRWTRLDSRKGLQADDRIVTLAPYRAPIKVGQVSVDLIGNVEVGMLGPAGDDVVLDLIQGRVLVHGANPPQALPVRFAGESLKVIPPANGVVMQRIGHRGTTDQRPLPAIHIYVPDGEAKLIGENETKTVARAGVGALATTVEAGRGVA